MSNTQIAAQLYTIRDFTRDAKAFAESMQKLQKIGYESVQISAIGPIDYKEVKKITDEYGMSICATHTSYDRLISELSDVIEQHKHWNCEYVGLGAMPEEFRKAPYEFVNTFKPIASEIAKNGLKFVYHNHDFEFARFDGKNAFDIIAENTDANEFGFLVDTFWVQAGGANPVKYLKKYGDRIDVVHLKDMGIMDFKRVMTEVGEGNMDWESILEACREIGVKWYAVEQDDCNGMDPFKCLETSFNNIKQMGLR